MKRVGWCERSACAAVAVVAVGLVSGCVPRHAVATPIWPQRRAGLWEESVSRGAPAAPGSPGAHARIIRVCLDPATEARISLFGAVMKGDCRRRATHAVGGRYDFTSVCPLPSGATLTAQGQASGDFNTRYHVRSRISIEGSPVALLNGEQDVEVEARWLGPCPTGMAPGQIAADDNRHVKINARLQGLARAFAGV